MNNQEPTSILPIDVGFDLKLHDMIIDIVGIDYIKFEGKNGLAQTITGPPHHIAITLLENGYQSVIIARSPNGRNIVADHEGIRVQPHNDNYWITVKSVEEAMNAYFHPEEYH